MQIGSALGSDHVNQHRSTDDSLTVRDRITLAVAEIAIVSLTILGWVLSYSPLRRLAEAHGYSGWEAGLWPLTVDLLALTSTMIAMALARRRQGPTGEAWAMAGVAALATLVGNVLSAWGDPVAMALHAWPAGCMVGAWHLFFRAVESDDRPTTMASAFQVRSADQQPPVIEGSRNGRTADGHGHQARQRRRPAIDELAVRIDELESAGHRVTGELLASTYQVSPRTGRRWLEELTATQRWP